MDDIFAGLTRFHFVGIGGIGMSALAQLLLPYGFSVTGSDLASNDQVEYLVARGVPVSIGHNSANLGKSEVVVHSTAVPPDNCELVEARKRRLRVIHRSELLAELMRFRKGITVAGTHGKTTTASLITAVLIAGGLDPGAALGAYLPGLGSNASPGKGDYFVAEADESDRSFLRLRPIWAVVTNIDSDHLDEYRDLEDLENAFTRHMNSVPFYGSVLACGDDPGLRRALRNVHRPVITYGLCEGCDYSARDIHLEGFRARYFLYQGEKRLGEIELSLAGMHNVENSVAAASAGLLLGIPFSTISSSLRNFAGVQRRLEFKGAKGDVWVMDDYGHHPSEIRATLEALRPLGRRLLVIFQPHRFTRSHILLDDLASCFQGTDELILIDIYSAGENPIEGVSSAELARRIREGRQVYYATSPAEAVRYLEQVSRKGDLVLTLGAGDVFRIGEAFLKNGS